MTIFENKISSQKCVGIFPYVSQRKGEEKSRKSLRSNWSF